jgi:hypothetical protein
MAWARNAQIHYRTFLRFSPPCILTRKGTWDQSYPAGQAQRSVSEDREVSQKWLHNAVERKKARLRKRQKSIHSVARTQNKIILSAYLAYHYPLSNNSYYVREMIYPQTQAYQTVRLIPPLQRPHKAWAGSNKLPVERTSGFVHPASLRGRGYGINLPAMAWGDRGHSEGG